MLQVQQSAAAQGLAAIELCDTNSKKFLHLLHISAVSYNDFVRTTEARHRQTAEDMWRAMQANGHISRQKFSGWYCVSDEVFVPEAATAPQDGGRRVSVESGHAVEWVEEENYIFTPGRAEQKLLQWLEVYLPGLRNQLVLVVLITANMICHGFFVALVRRLLRLH